MWVRTTRLAMQIAMAAMLLHPLMGLGQQAASSTHEAQPTAPAVENDKFIIGPNDVLMVNVWKEPDITRSLPVRPDGRISLPLAGDIEAAGRTPKQVQDEITEKLQAFISNPVVTVIVQEIKSQTFNVLGEVARPGSFVLSKPVTVLDALAQAGGFKDFAKRKSVYILRKTADGKQERLTFNYSDVVKGKHLEQNVELKPNDTVVVP
jgi:polysaccharide biosynthesis/export protein